MKTKKKAGKKKRITITVGKDAKTRRFDTFKRRIFYIFSRLAERGYITTAELAAKFEMDKRTALRDLDPLREEGILKETGDRSGRWEFDRTSHSFLKLELTDRDSSTMAFLYKLSKAFGGNLNKDVFEVIDKLFDVESQEYPFFIITQKVKNPAFRMPCYEEIYDAIRGRHKLNITYRKAGGEATVKGSPFSMVLCDGLWYLGYIPEDKPGDIRTLRASNLIKVEPLPDETFERPEWARDALKEAKNIWFSPARNNMVLRADNSVKEYFELAEYFPHQEITEAGPDGFTIKARYAHANEVVPTILRFLPAITVVEPAAIREELERRIKGYSA